MPNIAPAKDSHTFVVTGGNHGSSIGQLSDNDRGAALTLLARWIDTPSPSATLRSSRPSSVRRLDREDLGELRPPR